MFDNSNLFTQELELSKASTPAEFGLLFRAEREARGLTQGDVAASAGVRRQTIGELEEGGNVGLLTVFRALGALGKCLEIRSTSIELEQLAGIMDAP